MQYVYGTAYIDTVKAAMPACILCLSASARSPLGQRLSCQFYPKTKLTVLCVVLCGVVARAWQMLQVRQCLDADRHQEELYCEFSSLHTTVADLDCMSVQCV